MATIDRHVYVGQDIDGLWFVVKGHSGQDDYDYPGDWIAEGVGSWRRAMRIACGWLKRP